MARESDTNPIIPYRIFAILIFNIPAEGIDSINFKLLWHFSWILLIIIFFTIMVVIINNKPG
jgi:hypothetical protein